MTALDAQLALHGAVLEDATQLVELLLQQEINIDTRDQHGRTALFYAVQQGHVAIVKMLLEAGADPSVSEDNIADPIHYKIESSLYLRDLITRNTENQFGGLTPLFFAAGDGNGVKLLLHRGALPDTQDRFGERPINWAAARGYEGIVKMFLDKGANTNQLDHPSQSPVLWALGKHNVSLDQKVARKLIDPRDWPNPADGDMEKVVDMLLNNGADPNIVDEDGQTALSSLVARHLNSKYRVRLLCVRAAIPTRKINMDGPL